MHSWHTEQSLLKQVEIWSVTWMTWADIVVLCSNLRFDFCTWLKEKNRRGLPHLKINLCMFYLFYLLLLYCFTTNFKAGLMLHVYYFFYFYMSKKAIIKKKIIIKINIFQNVFSNKRNTNVQKKVFFLYSKPSWPLTGYTWPAIILKISFELLSKLIAIMKVSSLAAFSLSMCT